MPGYWPADVREALVAATVRAAAGRPTLVYLEGAAGMGKTTLLDELCVLAGDFAIGHADAAHAALRPYGLLAALGARLGDGDGVPEPLAAARALLDVIDELAARDRPVLLCVDDLHEADQESVTALAWVFRRACDERLLLAVAGRPGADHARRWPNVGARARETTHLTLDGLSAAAVGRLAAERWGSADETASRRLWEHTGGNPLYVTALLRERTREELREAHVLPAPAEFADAVTARLLRQPPAAADFARAASVLDGGWVAIRDVRAVAVGTDNADAGQAGTDGSGAGEAGTDVAAGTDGSGAGGFDADEAVQCLVDAKLLALGDIGGIASVRFAHALVRAAVYDGIALSRRRALHARAARVVCSPAAALEHRLAAADRYDDELADDLERHAVTCYVQRSYRVAARLLRWSSSVTSARGPRLRRLLDGHFAAALAHDDAAPNCAPVSVRDCGDLARATLIEGARACFAGRHADGIRVLSAIETWPAATGDPLTRYRVETLLAWSRTLLGHDTAQIAAGLRRAAALGVTDPALASHALMPFGHVHGGHGPVWAAFREQLAGLPQAPASVPAADTGRLLWRGALRLLDGHVDAALADLGETRRRKYHGRSDALSNAFDSMLSMTEWLAGRCELADVHFRSSLAAPPDTIGLLTPVLAPLPACVTGPLERADELIGHAGRLLDDQPWQEAVEAYLMVLVVRAHAGSAPGERATLLARLRRRFPRARLGEGLFGGVWSVHYALAQVWAGEHQPAGATLDRLDADPSAAEALPALSRWVRGQAFEARGEHARAYELLRLAADGDTEALPLYRAHVDADLARVAAATGHGDVAAAASRRAGERYAALGAATYLSRLARADAPTAPTAPASPAASTSPASPVDRLGLTQREHDIVTLVVAGYSYAQIARELFISRSTVSYHLGNIYDKAGVRSRHDLADRLRPRAATAAGHLRPDGRRGEV